MLSKAAVWKSFSHTPAFSRASGKTADRQTNTFRLIGFFLSPLKSSPFTPTLRLGPIQRHNSEGAAFSLLLAALPRHLLKRDVLISAFCTRADRGRQPKTAFPIITAMPRASGGESERALRGKSSQGCAGEGKGARALRKNRGCQTLSLA